jgi:phosphatidylinositol glycan class M
MERLVRFVCARKERELLLAALFVRACMVLYSSIHDGVFAVRYTDIDYDVVTDGARAMWRDFPSSAASPFERVTYRYTPLLALVMIPNVALFYAFGKLVLASCDVAAAWYAFDTFARTAGSAATASPANAVGAAAGSGGLLATANSGAAGAAASWRNPKFLLSAFLLFNPIVINVSTRGNSDMLVTFLVLAALSSFARHSYAAAGLFLGLSVHVKIYPIVYVPCFACGLLHRVASALAKQSDHHPSKPPLQLLIKAATSPAFITPLVTAAVGVVAGAGLPTLLCYAWYGQQYLDEALLYHIGRIDHRHNFSPYWYPMYLGMAARDVPGLLGGGHPGTTDAWLKTGLVAFVPQMGALLTAAWILRRNVAHAITVVTMIFVCFNKVCTVQYFVWFLPLLPFVFASGAGAGAKAGGAASGGAVVRGFALGLVWFVGIVVWMVMSVKVEFEGKPAYVPLWLASVFFFGMQVLVTRAVASAAVAGQRHDFNL